MRTRLNAIDGGRLSGDLRTAKSWEKEVDKMIAVFLRNVSPPTT